MGLRTASIMVVCAGFVVVPQALAQSSRPASSQSAGSVANSMGLLRALAGEWQGTLQGRNERNEMSSSVVSASIRLESGGAAVAARFDGFLFGEAHDGGSVWRQQGSSLSGAWMDSRLPEGVASRSSGADSAGSVSFVGQMSLPGQSREMNVRQVVRVLSPDHVSIEWFVVNAQGKELSVLSMDLNRLPKSERSAAASRFDEPVMAALREQVGASRQAGVQGD